LCENSVDNICGVVFANVFRYVSFEMRADIPNV